MNILLLYKNAQGLERIERTQTPIGLFWIGVALEGHTVEIMNLSTKEWAEIPTLLEDKKPDVVGLSISPQNRWQMFKLAHLIKNINYNTVVIAGGGFASPLPKDVLNHSNNIDVCVLGNGEATMKDVIDHLPGSLDSFKKIQGISFKENNEALFSSPGKDIITVTEKRKDSWGKVPALTFRYHQIVTSKGCSTTLMRPAASLIEEIKMLSEKGIKDFHIIDAMSVSDKERMKELCKGIEPLKIAWKCSVILDFLDKETIHAMKKAGCYQFEVQIDSEAAQKVVEMSKLVRAEGIEIVLTILLGRMEETDETVKHLLGVIEDIRPAHVIPRFFRYFPGSPLFEEKHASLWFDDLMHLPLNTVYRWDTKQKELTQWIKIVNGFFRDNQKKYVFSQEELEKLLERYPEDVFLLNTHAKILARKGDLHSAEKLLEDAITVNDGFYDTFLNLGICAEKQEKLAKAERNYLNAIELDFSNPAAHKNLGNVLAKQKKYAEAMKSFQQALVLNHPKHMELRDVIEQINVALQGGQYELRYK